MRVSRLSQYAVTKAASALAVPTVAADGVDVTAWTSSSGYARAHLRLSGTAANLTDALLWGYLDRWDLLGILYGGRVIPILAGRGYAEIITWATIYTHLAVSATGTDLAIAQEFTPLEIG